MLDTHVLDFVHFIGKREKKVGETTSQMFKSFHL